MSKRVAMFREEAMAQCADTFARVLQPMLIGTTVIRVVVLLLGRLPSFEFAGSIEWRGVPAFSRRPGGRRRH